MRFKTLVAASATTLTALLAPAAASADSIAYTKDNDVWLAKPDGSGAHRVTTDGTPDQRYHSPSQADDGTIAAAHIQSIVLMRQNGEVVREIDPPALTTSVGETVDGNPSDVAISPDGSLIAYTFARYSCHVTCGARRAMGYVRADGMPVPAPGLYGGDPSFVTNSRVLTFAGFGRQVSLHDAGSSESDAHWFDDYEIPGVVTGTDLADGEVSRQGDKLALVRSYGSDMHVAWYTLPGDPRTGAPPATPRAVCETTRQAGFEDPTWSPEGGRLAWAEPDGVWIVDPAATDPLKCADHQPRRVIDGAGEPDWGPADVAPGPRTQQPGPGPSPQPGPAPQPGPGVDPAPVARCTMPKVAGLTLASATKRVRATGCKVRSKQERSRKVRRGRVTRASAKPGKRLVKGSVVVLYVSRGAR
jgi:hypothetical protein